MKQVPLARGEILARLKVALAHEPKPSPLVQYLADYAVEKDPVVRRQISRRFYTRLNKSLSANPVPKLKQ